MKVKEWNLIVDEKEYNIKLKISNIFKGVNLTVNNQEVKFTKNVMTLRSYVTGIHIMFKIQEKDIVIYILNNKADLAIDGYFIESKRPCYYKKGNKDYTNLIFAIISLLTSVLTKNSLDCIIYITTIIIAWIYYIKINCRIDINNNQKFLRYCIVAIIHWVLSVLIFII